MRRFAGLAGLVALGGLFMQAGAAPLTVVADGSSGYSIYHAPAAPKSVQKAASELQRIIEIATGAKLPIKTEPSSPMLCLGVNSASRAAGLDKELPPFGFRLATKGQNIFILGEDTADGEEKWIGDARQGTLLGTFDFLERAANVRWLMPGDVGEDVPRSERLVVNDLDVRESPSISYRWLIGIKDKRADVDEWKMRNRVGARVRNAGVNWSHSFNSYPTPEMRKEHPEMMAVQSNGAPVRMDANHVMYCLSKPVLYDLYAQCITSAFEKDPRLYSMSMSPDEGVDFCQCPQCASLTTPVPDKWKDLAVNQPQHTAAVLRFYNEVARRVGARYPDRKVGAFIYQAYLVPLPEPIKMEPNIVFGVAMNTNYGFKLYEPRRRAIFQQFFDEWGKYGAEMGYYSYDTWMRNWFGMPLPPGRSMMKWNFPMYKRNHVQHLQYVGQDAWGYGAAHNYMAAKLMWNADADVDALYNEFLTRAYGSDAAPLIGRIYDMVDQNLQAYIQSAKKPPDHEIDYNAAKAIYGPIYPEIERLYLEAAGKKKNPAQQQRLEMFGDNLVLANLHMRKAKLISREDARKSPFYKLTEDVETFVQEKEKTISIIDVSEWLKVYPRYMNQMPILRVGWRPL